MDEIAKRFWPKVDISDGCWNWNASHQPKGYGTFRVDRKTLLAHRVSWELEYKQPIPAGMWVLHKCDNPRCVRPDHLFLGDHNDNMRDKTNKGRQSRGARTGMAKLNELQVRIIRRCRYLVDYPFMAEIFGVTKLTIYMAASGRHWKHVPSPTKY